MTATHFHSTLQPNILALKCEDVYIGKCQNHGLSDNHKNNANILKNVSKFLLKKQN
jgi:hypothetical protein